MANKRETFLVFERKADVVFIIFFMLLCISPVIHAPHNNYTVFNNGAHDILSLVDPYPAEWVKSANFRDWYLYSPTFGLFFLLFSTSGVGMYAGVYLWAMLNLFFFWFGFKSILNILDEKDALLCGGLYFFALLLVVNESMGTLTNLQSNAFIIGLSLLGVSWYVKGRYALSALALAVGFNFKLFPLAIALLLLMDFKPSFAALFILFSTAIFAIPLAILTSDFYFGILGHWVRIMLTDPVHSIFLGLEPTLWSYGYRPDGTWFIAFMLANALSIAAVAFIAFKKSPERFVETVVPLALLFIILFNKRSERQSFIIITPVLVFVLHAAIHARRKGNAALMYINYTVLAFAWFLISLSYSDLCPKVCRNFADATHFKTFGAMLLYVWAWCVAWGKLREGPVSPIWK